MPGSAVPPFALQGIDHVLLLVSGLSEALRFYCEVLGCHVENELPEFGMVQLRAGFALIDLVDIGVGAGQWARPGIIGGRNVDHLCLATGECDEHEVRRHLDSHAVTIVEEGLHKGARGNSLSIYFKDPSGNTIELKEGGDACSSI